MSGEYDDIIDLPHHVSKSRRHMSAVDRAAQFSPFAALTGYEDAVKETARMTDAKIELDENEIEELNRKLGMIADGRFGSAEVSITYFKPDERKSGGAYVTVVGRVESIDEFTRVLLTDGNTKIPIDDIIEITGDGLDT